MIEARTPPAAEDAVAVARSLSGEPDAFSTVFDRHYQAIYRFAAARLGTDLGEEVASQTFVVAWTTRARFDPNLGDVRPWLYGIATNLIRDHKRAERRRWAAYARVAREPSDLTAASDHRESGLGAAIADLNQGERDVVLLSAWAELSYDEIATALSLPVGTVRSRLSRARARLRAALETPKDNG